MWTATRSDPVESRRDGVEIVRYRPRLQPGGRAERRARRAVRSLFLISGAAAVATVAAYLGWPRDGTLYTPVLGSLAATTLIALGLGVVSWGKLLPPEVAVEQRRGEPAPRTGRRGEPAPRTGTRRLTRRPLLAGAVALGIASLAVPAAARLVRDPHASTDPRLEMSPMEHTGWHPALNGERPVRLVRDDGTPIRTDDVSVGGMVTAFPGIPGGATNRYADSPVMLIRLRQQDAAALRENLYELNRGSMAGDFVAYSKICTHVGCPASLYEQQTSRLLCPCHQSQFLVTDNARPVFGPATRSLAMLPIAVDGEGCFVATGDYKVPVGPSYWER